MNTSLKFSSIFGACKPNKVSLAKELPLPEDDIISYDCTKLTNNQIITMPPITVNTTAIALKAITNSTKLTELKRRQVLHCPRELSNCQYLKMKQLLKQ